MNIFVLDINPKYAAQFHYDRHVPKMILESAQMMSTAVHFLEGNTEGLYKPTHENHPCSIWARSSYNNYIWLWKLYYYLCKEYSFRFGKFHKTAYLADLLHPLNHKKILPNEPLLPFVKAMPKPYHKNSTVDSYREYYLKEKHHLLQYTKRELPLFVRFYEQRIANE